MPLPKLKLDDDNAAPDRAPSGEVLLGRPATREDLDRLPRTFRGEILNGTLYAFPRPRARHQRATGKLYRDVSGPFDDGVGGPGGWWILVEPGIELPSAPEVSPDIAGWRRERMRRLPTKGPIRIVPDWVCEVLSPRTTSYDLVTKRRFYASIGVPYLWYVEPRNRVLTAHQLNDDGSWRELGVWVGDMLAQVQPFDAVELTLAGTWDGFDPDEEESPSPPSTVVS